MSFIHQSDTRGLVAGSLLVVIAWLGSAAALSADERAYGAARQAMVDTIASELRATRQSLGVERLSQPVVEALSQVARHRFVPHDERDRAYLNRPLPIGHGQTISQPYIVAVMTELLEVDADDRVLEVGTGSGYQAAVLAEVVERVYTIEIIEPLASAARMRLKRLGYDNVRVRNADGYYGWPEHAPFDAIIVTAAAGQIPPPLIDQLKRGGRMMIPVGSRFATQHLVLVTKDAEGHIRTRQLLPVRFVPLTGEH